MPRDGGAMAELDGATAALKLFSPSVADDPHATYAEMRSQCPVARGDLGGHDVVLLSRYDDVLFALRHPEAFTSAGGNLNLGEQPLLPLEVDPPVHTAYRRVLNPRFVPTRGREARARGSERPWSTSSTGSRTGGAATSTRSSPRRCPRASSSRSWGCRWPTCPMFMQWRDNTIRPDVAPGRHGGRGADPRGDGPRHQRVLPRRDRRAARRNRTTPCCRPIVHATIDGEPLAEAELLGISHLLLLGGLDTVTATLDCMVGLPGRAPGAPAPARGGPVDASRPPWRSCCAG